MKKTPLNNLDLTLWHEVLDNGLNVYIVPFNKSNNIYVTYSTKYGSNQNEFIPIDEKKMVKVPGGIAHFLEHKMFEQEDGKDPFEFFGERGADANANTGYEKTTYLFVGTDFFEENLSFLLNYVESPYFTDENVKKEKGIIEQEIKMYQDMPHNALYEGLLKNLFNKHPNRYPIIGSIKSVNSITKEDLYTCYNTFYHPSNMFLVITGCVNPEKTIELIKNIESKRKLKAAKTIKLKEYDEEDKVFKKQDTKVMNVTIPKCGIAYKFNVGKYKHINKRSLYYYGYMIINNKLGYTSPLVQKLRDEGIINSPFFIEFLPCDNYVAVLVATDTKKPQKVLDAIIKEMEDLTIDEKDFERYKKVIISSFLYASDNVFGINSDIMSQIIKHKEVNTDMISYVRNLKYKEIKKITDEIDASNYTTYIINNN